MGTTIGYVCEYCKAEDPASQPQMTIEPVDARKKPGTAQPDAGQPSAPKTPEELATAGSSTGGVIPAPPQEDLKKGPPSLLEIMTGCGCMKKSPFAALTGRSARDAQNGKDPELSEVAVNCLDIEGDDDAKDLLVDTGAPPRKEDPVDAKDGTKEGEAAPMPGAPAPRSAPAAAPAPAPSASAAAASSSNAGAPAVAPSTPREEGTEAPNPQAAASAARENTAENAKPSATS